MCEEADRTHALLFACIYPVCRRLARGLTWNPIRARVHRRGQFTKRMLALLICSPIVHVRLYRVPSGPDALPWATANAPSFRALDILGFPPHGLWTEAQFVREFTSQLSTVLGVWDERGKDSSLVAFACCEHVLDETHMLSLTVHPDWRGRGLAKTLVLASLLGAKAAGQRLLTLEVRTSNGESVANAAPPPPPLSLIRCSHCTRRRVSTSPCAPTMAQVALRVARASSSQCPRLNSTARAACASSGDESATTGRHRRMRCC